MDVSNTIPCRYCGILFDDWDNLQKHLMYGCVYHKKGNEEVPPKQPQNTKQKLEDAFDEDLENDLVFTKLFEDAKEMHREEWEKICDQYIADGTPEKESAGKAHADMLEKYKQDFFNQYIYNQYIRFSTHRGDAFWNSLYNNGRFYVHVAHF